MRNCQKCVHARCHLAPSPHIPDVWACKARGDEIQLHPILRAITCRAYESRYRLRIEKKES